VTPASDAARAARVIHPHGSLRSRARARARAPRSRTARPSPTDRVVRVSTQPPPVDSARARVIRARVSRLASLERSNDLETSFTKRSTPARALTDSERAFAFADRASIAGALFVTIVPVGIVRR